MSPNLVDCPDRGLSINAEGWIDLAGVKSREVKVFTTSGKPLEITNKLYWRHK
jgi:hypothetical protein